MLARVILVASLALTSQQLLAAESPDPAGAGDGSPCHWWQFHCDQNQQQTQGLPPDAPRTGTLITVDVATNHLYLFQDGKLVDKSLVATGTEKVLKKAGKTWLFHTPRGRLTVLRKIEDPIWTKPDWAFVEDGDPVPPPDSPKRQVKGHLGKYALDLGDGIMIHGTDDVGSFGKRASHGCIRVPGDMLETLWDTAKIGTPVYIFESEQPQADSKTANSSRKPERHSDLD
ncbi:MAG TPA: L,D-transpeptidase [Thermoanaerobaculia bacterium]